MQIPGYYFDPEKKRYFKVSANKAAPSSHPFTVTALREKEEEQKRKESAKALAAQDLSEVCELSV
ncbi:hypothetical protein HK102_010572 [Quaeritorhiza haematococci]|nr:hypothetical protein HK102_010572 [Quaeritorhiza haematococci]